MPFAGITKERLERQVAFADMMDWTYEQLAASIRAHAQIAKYRPDGVCRVDPRNRERIVFSQSRGNRPMHTAKTQDAAVSPEEEMAQCPVCTGKTTPIIDLAPLPSGKVTFINSNLYPIVHPDLPDHPDHPDHPALPGGEAAHGIHLLQWLTNDHFDDIDNMDLPDLHATFARLALLEAKLLHGRGSKMPNAADGPPHNGYVGTIKNFGRPVGGSVAHGHLQIVHTNVLPRRIEDDMRFEKENGVPFARHILETNPPELTVADFGGKVRMLIPQFMRRPLDAFFIPLDTDESHLHHLEEGHLAALAEALRFATAALKPAMAATGTAYAYNIIFHTGPVGLLYAELLPFTQPLGGYEKMGLFVCHGSPDDTARIYREHAS